MDTGTAFTTPTTAFVTDWTRLAWRLSPAIQSIRRPAPFAVITFRFMPDDDDLHHAELPALNEGISQERDEIFDLGFREFQMTHLPFVDVLRDFGRGPAGRGH